MKRYIFLITICISANLVFAKCGFRGIEVFPKNQEIFTNSNIIINGNYDDIDRIQKTMKVYLFDGKQKIGFNVLKVNHGYKLHQLILKPIENLNKGNKYQLIIENPNSTEYIFKDKKLIKNIEEVYEEWLVSKYDYIYPLFWVQKPKLLGSEFLNYGCGPSKIVTISINTLGKSDSHFIKVSLKKKGSTTEKTFAVMIEKTGKITVGHDMCYGHFIFEENEHYNIKLELVNFAGNIAKESYFFDFKTPKMDSNI